MAHSTHHHHNGCCSHAVTAASTVQTLDELDFERGVWAAAFNDDALKVSKYLTNGGDPNAPDSAGYTALHYAARNGHTSIVRQVLDAGACINVQTRSGRATALHKAAYGGHKDVVQLLLNRGADCTLLDSDGKRAYDKAMENEKMITAVLLKQEDAIPLS